MPNVAIVGGQVTDDARARLDEEPGVQVTYGNQNWSTAIQGSPPAFTVVREWPIAKGRMYGQSEENSAAKVAVIGQTLVDKLFAPGEDPLDATVRMRNVPFRVVGVLAAKGQTSWGQDQDDVVIVPFSTAERRLIGTPSSAPYDPRPSRREPRR